RRERAAQPETEVLAQVGDDVGLVADAAQQGARAGQRGPAGLVAMRDRDGLAYAGPAQLGRDQAERGGGAEDDGLGVPRLRDGRRAAGDRGHREHQRRRVPNYLEWLLRVELRGAVPRGRVDGQPLRREPAGKLVHERLDTALPGREVVGDDQRAAPGAVSLGYGRAAPSRVPAYHEAFIEIFSTLAPGPGASMV